MPLPYGCGYNAVVGFAVAGTRRASRIRLLHGPAVTAASQPVGTTNPGRLFFCIQFRTIPSTSIHLHNSSGDPPRDGCDHAVPAKSDPDDAGVIGLPGERREPHDKDGNGNPSEDCDVEQPAIPSDKSDPVVSQPEHAGR